MRFEQRLRDGIHSGAIMLAFRHWKRSQVVPGRRYRTGIDMVEVESMAAFPVYRIRLRRIDRPDPRDELARSASLTEADVAAITARLAWMDSQAAAAVDRRGARADR